MPRQSLLNAAIVTLTSFAMVTPQAALLADNGPKAKTPGVQINRAATVANITLGDAGTLSGRVVDHAGTPLEGAAVVVRQGEKTLAQAVTDEQGVFAVPRLSTGVYEVSSGNTSGRFRLWNEEVAPPAAKGQALLVMGENGTRGQFGAVDPTLVILTATTIASVVVSAITLSEVNDLQEEIDQINNTLGN